MNLTDILQLKFPDASYLKDIILQDDGQGVYIKEWNLKSPKPNKSTIARWQEELGLEYRQKEAIRARKYPPIEVQLDMLYHDKIQGTDTWVEAIAQVKANNPVPEE